jgi:dihydroorotate dehydrogenase electron transfer subunit
MTKSESKKFLSTAEVLWNHRIGPEYFRMGLGGLGCFDAAAPGQFVMIRPQSQAQPLLRRPFSIHNVVLNNQCVCGIEILYKVIGEGTQKLAECRPADRVDVLGPLGNSFSALPSVKSVTMAAGGIGVAPFVFLAETLMKQGLDSAGVTVFLGGRTRNDILCRDAFHRLGLSVRIATDDGSDGEKNLVTVPLEKAVRREKPDIIYACGPVPMLKAVMNIVKTYQIRCEVSIETMMACGMGACLGCAVESRLTEKKYLHACIDGPVFAAEAIRL